MKQNKKELPPSLNVPVLYRSTMLNKYYFEPLLNFQKWLTVVEKYFVTASSTWHSLKQKVEYEIVPRKVDEIYHILGYLNWQTQIFRKFQMICTFFFF